MSVFWGWTRCPCPPPGNGGLSTQPGVLAPEGEWLSMQRPPGEARPCGGWEGGAFPTKEARSLLRNGGGRDRWHLGLWGMELEFESMTAIFKAPSSHCHWLRRSTTGVSPFVTQSQFKANLCPLLLSEPQFPHCNTAKTKTIISGSRILEFLEGEQLARGGGVLSL